MLMCLATQIINLTNLSWNEDDRAALKRARYVCRTDERYKYDTPCLVRFTKKAELEYLAICGAKK